MRIKNLILIFAALATVVVLAACGSSGQSSGDQGNQAQGNQANQEEPQAPQKNPDKQEAPKQGSKESSVDFASLKPATDEMLRLTVPEMKRINNSEIPTGIGTDEALFHDYAAVHLKSTGFPWEQGANVYIAGHRLGFPGTKSNLAFDDLDKLEKGDEFYITDSEGRKYTYEVFRKYVTPPSNLSALGPVEGKNIATLQTCTKPDYVDRLLVRGELKEVDGA